MALDRLDRLHQVRPEEFPDPSWYRSLFASSLFAPLWLLVRFYIGWQWLHSGWGKVRGDGWVDNNGAALQGFWERIVVVPEGGRGTITYDWYRDFIQYMLDNQWYEWFAPLIAWGEVVAGLALIMGLLVGLAALGTATMNFNFMLAGSASTNPVLFLGAVLLILAWKVAGRIGLDRWVLPALGTPWAPGLVFGGEPPPDRSAP
ncbi:MAG: DoxX family membrane protein [Dehalococcoidia bacterium]|nr:DoxX family membrane protein [Dehalococcoidia bacterium]